MSYTIPGYPNGAAVKAALDRAMAVSNPNLLINGDFQSPVNQRGQSAYSAPGYTIDNWYISPDGAFDSITLGVGGLTFVCEGTRYWGKPIEGNSLAGKTCTVSIKLGGTIHALTMAFPATPGSQTTYTPLGTSLLLCSFQFAASGTYMRMMFGFPAGTYENLAWAKLEESPVATPFVPRPFAENLALCQRYYVNRKLSGCYSTAFSSAALTGFTFPAEMRIAPTMTWYNYNGSVSGVVSLAGVGTALTVTGQNVDKIGVTVIITDSTTAGNIYVYGYEADAEIY